MAYEPGAKNSLSGLFLKEGEDFFLRKKLKNPFLAAKNIPDFHLNKVPMTSYTLSNLSVSELNIINIIADNITRWMI